MESKLTCVYCRTLFIPVCEIKFVQLNRIAYSADSARLILDLLVYAHSIFEVAFCLEYNVCAE